MRTTVRIQTALSPELIEKLDNLCKKYGTTKSGLIAYYVGRAVETETQANNLMTSDTVNMLMKAMLDRGDIPYITLPDGTKLKRKDDEE
jgi:hypothetical protein